jgi:phosphopantetheine--protein transferase-like protein
MLNIIGNDIVDWSLLKLGQKAEDHRYLSKILLPSEIEQVQAAEQSEQCLWRIWTIKEACYKAITQQHHFRAYIPKKIEVQLLSAEDASVSSIWGNFKLKTKQTAAYIHSWTIAPNNITPILKVIDGLSLQNASQRLKTVLVEDFAGKFNVPQTELLIKKEGELPFIYHKGIRLPYRLSLSRDGSYGAYAILPIS